VIFKIANLAKQFFGNFNSTIVSLKTVNYLGAI